MNFLFLLIAILHIRDVHALWPFKQKRYTSEAFINAGPLGLEGVGGRVVAVGDWDGDQQWASCLCSPYPEKVLITQCGSVQPEQRCQDHPNPPLASRSAPFLLNNGAS